MVGSGGSGLIRIHSAVARAARTVRWPATDMREVTWLLTVLDDWADSRRRYLSELRLSKLGLTGLSGVGS